jgi:hypothetical protein
MENLSKNPSQEAYEYAKRHPGEAYFPWNPISSLLAEGKLYHTTFGLWDRDLAGLKISDEHVRAYIPRNIKIMAFRLSKTEDRRIGRFLPEFKRKVTVEGLPGWTVYASE